MSQSNVIFVLIPALFVHMTIAATLPFILDIPSLTPSCSDAASCEFIWPSTAHYGYSFVILNDQHTSIDLDSRNAVNFSALHFPYNGYEASESCNASDTSDSYNYQIFVYYHDGVSWTTKGTKSGIIRRENSVVGSVDVIPLYDLSTPIALTTGKWFIGIEVSWQRLLQQCDFIVNGWQVSNAPAYPIASIVSSIPTTQNDRITFTAVTCLNGDDLSTLNEPVLPALQIEFTALTAAPTTTPTSAPTMATFAPTDFPTPEPSGRPSLTPTHTPTVAPTAQTASPTLTPSQAPTALPTTSPSSAPSTSPSSAPTSSPTISPTAMPTLEPTDYPTPEPSERPSFSPTIAPTSSPTLQTASPTFAPTTAPTASPTQSPTLEPTMSPTPSPSLRPTSPTLTPTAAPSPIPTTQPTFEPTTIPTSEPTTEPTTVPTTSPTQAPTIPPTNAPTESPTDTPTNAPTLAPTTRPSGDPTHSPSLSPSHAPTSSPTMEPTFDPTSDPTTEPTTLPTVEPTHYPTQPPTAAPSSAPTVSPTHAPTLPPTVAPTGAPNNDPTRSPSPAPSNAPTLSPTVYPTTSPTSDPTTEPTTLPTAEPTTLPSREPTRTPSTHPTVEPTSDPTSQPTLLPTMSPTGAPIVSIADNTTHIQLLFRWNITAHSIDFEAMKHHQDDVSAAIVHIAIVHYNATLTAQQLYVYGDGVDDWLHFDVFTFCAYSPPPPGELMHECQRLQKDKTRLKALVSNALIKANSALANMDATLTSIDRLADSQPLLSAYPDSISVARGQLSEHGIMITIDFQYLSLAVAYTPDIIDCSDIFWMHTLQLFGNGSYCSWRTSSVLAVHLGFDHGIAFESVDAYHLLYRADIFVNVPPVLIIQTKLLPPRTISTPDVMVIGSRHIGRCDDLVLRVANVKGNMGKSLSYEWSVYYESFLLRPNKVRSSEFVLSAAALQTFAVNLLKIELFIQNWLGANNTRIVYIHYDQNSAIPSLEIRGNNLQYRSLWDTNIVITPNAQPSACDANAVRLSYAWQQMDDVPVNVLAENAVPWPTQCVANYSFAFAPTSKSLWLKLNSSDFAVSFLSSMHLHNVSVLPCVYFKLNVAQWDAYDNVQTSVVDYVAIQFVVDAPSPLSVHTIVHNIDRVLTLSAYDYFAFTSRDDDVEDGWVETVYNLEWQCAIFNAARNDFSTECSINCPFNEEWNDLFDDDDDDETDAHSQIYKVLDYGCFDPSNSGALYRIALTVQIKPTFVDTPYHGQRNVSTSNVLYIQTTTDANMPAATWTHIPTQTRTSMPLRYRLSLAVTPPASATNLSWTCSDAVMCPSTLFFDAYPYFLSDFDVVQNVQQLMVHPYRSVQSILRAVAPEFELQLLWNQHDVVASVVLSLDALIVGPTCSITAGEETPTSFTVSCGGFASSFSEMFLRFNLWLVNHALSTNADDFMGGTWLYECFLTSSRFEFVLGAGNYSVYLAIATDSDEIIAWYRIPDEIHVSLPLSDDSNESEQKMYIERHMNDTQTVIHYAVQMEDYALLVQTARALSDFLCTVNYSTWMVIANDTYLWRDLVTQTLTVFANITTHVSSIPDFGEYSRLQIRVAVYRYILRSFHCTIFQHIYEQLPSVASVDEQQQIVVELLQLTQVMPSQMLQTVDAYLSQTATAMTRDLYFDLLTIADIMRQSDNDLSAFIGMQTDNLNANDVLQAIGLMFSHSNALIVAEGAVWESEQGQMSVQIERSSSNAVYCNEWSSFSSVENIDALITTAKADCVTIRYAPQNSSLVVSDVHWMELFSVDDANGMQAPVESNQFALENKCGAITFLLPIATAAVIDDAAHIYYDDGNETFTIPQCAYFDWNNETWSTDGCWMVNYTLNHSWCACERLPSSFSLTTTTYKPEISLVSHAQQQSFSLRALVTDPFCWIFVCVAFVCFVSALVCVPANNAVPLIARSNIIFKAEKFKMLPQSWIGSILLLMMSRGQHNRCSTGCRLYRINLRNRHSLCAVCCSMEGLNITRNNLCLLFMCYVVTVMVLSAVFYADIAPLFNSDELHEFECCIYISLLSMLPLYIFRCFFKHSKPTMMTESYYFNVDDDDDAQHCVPLVDEDHSVSFSSLAGAGYNGHKHTVDLDVGGQDAFIGVNGHVHVEKELVPGAEWKCDHCDRFNNAEYQFCGYCAHKRLPVVEETLGEEVLDDNDQPTPILSPTQPGSIPMLMVGMQAPKQPSAPSMNAPKPMLPTSTNQSMNANEQKMSESASKKKRRRKKRHSYKKSDSSMFGDGDIDREDDKYKYTALNMDLNASPATNRHVPRQSSVLSSIFADTDDLGSESVSVSTGSSDTNTVDEAEDDDFKTHDAQHMRQIVSARKTSANQKHIWSMSSGSPTMSAVSHTTLGTNLDTLELNAAATGGTIGSALSAKLQHKSQNNPSMASTNNKSSTNLEHQKLVSNLSDFTDENREHSHIGGIDDKMGILQQTRGQKVQSASLQSQSKQHLKGISSMSSMVNYHPDNLSMMTDLDTSIDVEHDMVALQQLQLHDLDDENMNRFTSITRRGSGQNARQMRMATPGNVTTPGNVDATALPAAMQTTQQNEAEPDYEHHVIDTDIGATPIAENAADAEIAVHSKQQEEQKYKSKANKNNPLYSMLIETQRINALREKIIERNFRLCHHTKTITSIVLWIYIGCGLLATLYCSMYFAASDSSTADDADLSEYADCMNHAPFSVALNYQFSEENTQSISTTWTVLSTSELTYSAQWGILVAAAVLLYTLVWLPLLLFMVTILMLYNTARQRTVDTSCRNLCYGLLLKDILCCCDRCGVLQKYRQNESELANKKHDFQGVSTKDLDEDDDVSDDGTDEDDRLRTPTRERLHSLSGDDHQQIMVEKNSERSLDAMKKKVYDRTWTEYAFLCHDEIFISSTKEHKQRFQCTNNGDSKQLAPSSVQRRISLQNKFSAKNRSRSHKVRRSSKKPKKRRVRS